MKRIKKFLHDLWHHFFWHAIILPIFWVLTAVNKYFLESAESKSFLDQFIGIGKKVIADPWMWGGLILIGTAFKYIFQLFDFLKNSWLRLKQLESLVQAVGLRSFSHHSETQKEQDWGVCKETLDRTKVNQLFILGAAGYETFSGPQSPLYEFVSNANCELKILLLNPESKSFSQRCKHINVSEKKYREWIDKSIEFCKNLKSRKNIPVEVRLYDDYPIWKMIFTSEYMWLQWYQNVNVDQTPVYNLQTTAGKDKTSLYYPMHAVFRRRWDAGKVIDLEGWVKTPIVNSKVSRRARK